MKRSRKPRAERIGKSPSFGGASRNVGSEDRLSVLTRLLDLAYDSTSYLRQSPQQAVRVSGALLLAASLSACMDVSGPQAGTETPQGVVQPLTQEVKSGLPQRPGRYPIFSDSVRRDQQGAYHFDWREAEQPVSSRTQASASLVKLLQANEDSLEIPERGDPVLRLKGDTPVTLLASAGDLRTPTPQAGATRSTGGFFWYPFYAVVNPYPSPVYYDPPTRTLPQSGVVQGAERSSAPKPLAERTVGLPGAVSGRAGGAGSGTAATNRATGGKSAAVGAPKSSGFSAGTGSAFKGSSS